MNTYPNIMNYLEDTLNDLFIKFQKENDIECGDIPPHIGTNLELAKDRLATVILSAMDWQEENAPRAKYEQTYAPDTDTTFIMKETYVWGDLVKREVVGFYSGEPTAEDFETYKDMGTVAEY